MSLDAEQRRRTAAELRENLERSGVRVDEARAGTGLDERAFLAALEVGPASGPADVWLVRDRLDALVRDAGRDPVPYTVLTEDMRAAASIWFGVR